MPLLLKLLRKADALTVGNRCSWIGIIGVTGLIVENNLSGFVVPDFEPEFIYPAALWRLTVNYGQEVFVTNFIVDFAETFELSSGAGKFSEVVVKGVEFQVSQNKVDQVFTSNTR